MMSKRNPIKQFFVSFIPRHVGNSIVLRAYHLLTLIPVPKATVYHDAKDIALQIHTVCITERRQQIYSSQRISQGSERGYVASISYTTLKEAIAHISGKEVKMIYLIGIAGHNRNKPIFATT